MIIRWMVALLWLGTGLFAQTSVWKVTYKDRTLYLGGTVHVMRPSDYPLPEAYGRAFAAADTLVFETDMGTLRSPLGAAELRQRLMFAAGKTLRDVLLRDTYMRVKKYAVGHEIPMELFDGMKPQLVVLSVMGLELQKLGMAEPGADLYYFELATQAHKRVRWFESAQEQMRMLESMGSGDVDTMVRQSLEELPHYPAMMASMLAAWRGGDARTLEQLGKKYLMHESPAEYRSLIVDRNRAWMPMLQEMVRSPETEFVLVGVLHLVGPEGLISRLKRKGYRVEQL